MRGWCAGAPGSMGLCAPKVDLSAEIFRLHLCSSVWWDSETLVLKLKPISDKGGRAPAIARGQLSIWQSIFLIKGYSWS